MKKGILITGGAGFIGSNLAIKLKKEYPDTRIIAFDNLKRRGSELNVPRLKETGVDFVHGDIRSKEDLEALPDFDIIIDCCAEPSVLAEFKESPEKVISTNLGGTVNCLEECRRRNAKMVFLSTSRVYPIDLLNKIKLKEGEKRFEIDGQQEIFNFSGKGISENFGLEGPRTLYGTTKLCSELIIAEYSKNYGIPCIINRCGVVAGPWQMGKVDQGVVSLWVANHVFNGNLSYIGFGGEGKQVRDVLHIDDLYNLINLQLRDFDNHNGEVYNVGGGTQVSFSLKELTELCENVTQNKISIGKVMDNRPGDIPCYVTDFTKINQKTGWKPEKSVKDIVHDTYKWIEENKNDLKDVFF